MVGALYLQLLLAMMSLPCVALGVLAGPREIDHVGGGIERRQVEGQRIDRRRVAR